MLLSVQRLSERSCGCRKMLPPWFIDDWSVCPMIWRACANCALVTDAFSIGFIIPRRVSVSIEFSIGLRSIGVSDIFHSSPRRSSYERESI